MDEQFPVAEIFTSINGEGILAGQLAVFVRFCGCNLRCSFCDTMWANEEQAPRTMMTADEICREVQKAGVNNVTLTGGEPLLQRGLPELIRKLTEDPRFRVEIETNGSQDLAPLLPLKNTTFTMDYKLPGSGMESGMRTENFQCIRPEDTVKFVAGSEEDLLRAKDIMEEYNLVSGCHVYFSPVFGRIEPAEIVEFMIRNRMNGVNMQLQMHKFIWDPNARGV